MLLYSAESAFIYGISYKQRFKTFIRYTDAAYEYMENILESDDYILPIGLGFEIPESCMYAGILIINQLGQVLWKCHTWKDNKFHEHSQSEIPQRTLSKQTINSIPFEYEIPSM
jgi:hypothetical protein